VARSLPILLTLVLLTTSVTVDAQTPATTYRIGLLSAYSRTSPEAAHLWSAFLQGMRDLGYVEGRNLVVESRFSGERVERLPALADELVRSRVDLIVAGAPPAPEAAKGATSTIPIVMALHTDPVTSGLVATLARPGGNITGMSSIGPELEAKRLQMLKEVIPRLSQVAVLTDPTLSSQRANFRVLEPAARALQIQLQVVEARAPRDLDTAFAAATRERAGALVVVSSPMFFRERGRITELAVRHRLPAVYGIKEVAKLGGLMTYGVDFTHTFRRAATYVDKILKGAKPADLPVEQPTKFDLVVNLRTAKTLGFTIPPQVLAQADEIIE
jgi:putative ABC transport system substrate-binding protein